MFSHRDLHLAVLNDPRKDSVEIDFLLEILCEGMGKQILLFYLFVSVLNINVTFSNLSVMPGGVGTDEHLQDSHA